MKKMILMLMAMVVFGNVLGAAIKVDTPRKIKSINTYSDANSVVGGNVTVILENMETIPGDIDGFWLDGSLDENKALLSALMISYINGLPITIHYDNTFLWNGASSKRFFKIYCITND